jgi:tetratricopeptide (TPR) repeat protein
LCQKPSKPRWTHCLTPSLPAPETAPAAPKLRIIIPDQDSPEVTDAEDEDAQDTAEDWAAEAKTYKAQKDYAEAARCYSEAIALEPENPRYYNFRGNAYFKLEEYAKALADYTSALDLDPSKSHFYRNRANTYMRINETEKAIAGYTTAIEIESDNGEMYYSRGVAYAKIGETEKALADYTKSIEIEETAKAYANRGIQFKKLKDYPKAIADFERAIELDHPQSDILQTRIEECKTPPGSYPDCCPNCGVKTNGGKFCSNCGTALGAPR